MPGKLYGFFIRKEGKERLGIGGLYLSKLQASGREGGKLGESRLFCFHLITKEGAASSLVKAGEEAAPILMKMRAPFFKIYSIMTGWLLHDDRESRSL